MNNSIVRSFQIVGFTGLTLLLLVVASSAAGTFILVAENKTLSVGETWDDIGKGYTLTVSSIDEKVPPKKVWIVFLRNGTKLDDKILIEGETYTYSNIFITKVTNITENSVWFENTSLTSTDTPTSTPTLSPTPTSITTPFELNRGYKLNLLPDSSGKFPEITLQLIHSDTVIDEKTFGPGNNFSFYDGQSLIIRGRFDTLFGDKFFLVALISNLVQLDNVTGEMISSKDKFYLIGPRYASSSTPTQTISGTPVITPSITLTPIATQATTPVPTMISQLGQEVKELNNGLNKTEERPSQQDSRISWLESTLNSLLDWLKSIF